MLTLWITATSRPAAEAWLNVGFTVFFALEMVIKLVGYGHRQYFQSASNCVDAALVAGSIVSAALNSGTIGTMLRIFRIARVFRLVQSSGRVRRLMRTLAHALPVFINILAIILLDIFSECCPQGPMRLRNMRACLHALCLHPLLRPCSFCCCWYECLRPHPPNLQRRFDPQRQF